MAEIIVVPHTHWDREWYLPFERYRYQLVKLVGELLDILRSDKEYVHFLLDGQVIVAEDYLEIRPENEERLREEVAKGRIGLGPWYTMPDEFLAGGEALIRNLLMGHRLGRKLGGVMKIGYLPDPFGHIAQMPQILRGFGIHAAFLARGVDPPKTEFYWEAPDGSRVLTHWFALGYCNARCLTEDPDAFRTEYFQGLSVLRDLLLVEASTETILLMNGCDHMAPQANLTRIIKALNRRMDDEIMHGSLADFTARVRAKNPPLPTVRGELRNSKNIPILPGVLSSRIYLKQRNHRVHTLLEGYAEPIAAFAWSLGEDYPAAFLQRAWKLLLQNHFHDSICASSVDQVHREMMLRFEKAEQIAEEVTQDYLKRIGKRVGLDGQGIALLVFNPTARERTDRVSAWVEPMVKLPYGRCQVEPLEELDLGDFALLDPEGKPIPFRLGERKLFSEDVLNGAKHLEKVRLSFLAEKVPPFGYRVYEVRRIPKRSEPTPSLLRGERTLENEFLRVEFENDGTLTVTDKATGAVYRSLGYFEDSGDAGDEYNYSPPDFQEVLDTKGSPAEIEVAEDEPDWATVRIRHLFHLPEGLTPDRKERSSEKMACEIASFVTLQRGARRVDIRTIVENRARDHRLRVAFPTGIPATESIAESAFAVVRRPVRLPIPLPPLTGAVPPQGGTGGWAESPSPTHPQERFVAVEGNGQGLAVLNKGLPEYEVTEDGVIYLTLLRCVGWLSRDDLKTRPGHAGPPYEVPDAQCLGRHIFEYAIMPYGGNWLGARVWEEAARFNLPLVAVRVEGRGRLPESYSFLRVEPEELVVSAIKRAEDDEALIVRLYNIADQEARGALGLHIGIAEAVETNLNEEEKEALEIVGGEEVPLRVRGCEVKTIKLNPPAP
jgi:alpha-mannosidase